MAFTPISAQNAKVRIGNSTLVAHEWTATPSNDAIDTTNFEGGGYHEEISSINKLDVNVRCFWDSGANQYANPPNIKAGQVLTNTKLYLNDTTGSYFGGNIRVATCPTHAAVKGGVEFEFTGTATGAFTYPA